MVYFWYLIFLNPVIFHKLIPYIEQPATPFTIHLGAIDVVPKSVHKWWPLASILAPDDSHSPIQSQSPSVNEPTQTPVELTFDDMNTGADDNMGTSADHNVTGCADMGLSLSTSTEDTEQTTNKETETHPKHKTTATEYSQPSLGEHTEQGIDDDGKAHPKHTKLVYVSLPPPRSVPPMPSKKRKTPARLSSAKASLRSVSVDQRITPNAQRHVPLVVGNTYVKIEDINLDELRVMFPKFK